jgi:hypothetical protein
MFLSLYKNALNEAIPSKTRKFHRKKHKKQGWMTKGILNSIKNKTKLYKIKIQASGEQDILETTRKYNSYRNILNKIIRNAKRLHYVQLFEDSKNYMKLTWQNIRKLLQKNKNATKFHKKFDHNGTCLTNMTDILQMHLMITISILDLR